jgi:PIN domain nuclease of toxin-antitoxin system
MKLLLDTHALLWFISNDAQLSEAAKKQIENESNEVLVSIGSLWEISIKLSLGKLRLPLPFEQVFPQQLDVNSFEVLPIACSAHYLAVSPSRPIRPSDHIAGAISAI